MKGMIFMKKALSNVLIMLMLALTLPVNLKAKTIDMGEFKLTAYCPCYECSEGWGRKTSTGKYARSGHTIAVDPSVIGYGAKVLIDGDIYVAEDCGGGVSGDHIDIFFDTHEEVEDFGMHYRDVWIVK